jgi:hypothetical protein
MSDPLVGWQKLCFFLSNDADMLLPVFTGSHSIPQPNWRYNVAQKDLHRLQPLSEVVQWLLHGGLSGTDLLRTFVSCHVQPLLQWEMTIWIYPRPSCLDHPFSTELGNTDINTRIRGVLPHGADQSFGSGLVPLRECHILKFSFRNVNHFSHKKLKFSKRFHLF